MVLMMMVMMLINWGGGWVSCIQRGLLLAVVKAACKQSLHMLLLL